MEKAKHYVGVVHKEADSDYGVSFPEVPGVATAGRTLEEAAAFAEEALALHLEGLSEDGDDWPAAQGIDAVREHPDSGGAVAFLAVRAPQPPGKLVRVNITMDERVLSRIDRAAKERGLTRSAFLALAGQAMGAVANEPDPSVAANAPPAARRKRG